jgi:hypothetical protein
MAISGYRRSLSCSKVIGRIGAGRSRRRKAILPRRCPRQEQASKRCSTRIFGEYAFLEDSRYVSQAKNACGGKIGIQWLPMLPHRHDATAVKGYFCLVRFFGRTHNSRHAFRAKGAFQQARNETKVMIATKYAAVKPRSFGIAGAYAARAALAGLFILLVVLEVTPIVVVMATDGLWFMNIPEEFTATLWPPLKGLLPGSHFYHYFGFLYYTAIRPAHWLTEWWLGSPEVTIAYTQVYGTIIKAAFSAATIALASWVIATRALPFRAKLATLLFMLALLVADPDFYWIYHTRVSYALSVKLFATVLLILTLIGAERVLERRQSSAGVTAIVGAIGGTLFFEHLLYLPLVLYPTLLIALTTPLRLLPIRALIGATAAMAAALAMLAVFFAGDVDSMNSAVSSHVAGLIAGNPMIQPGHHEQFITLFLDRRSVYFACHVILVAGALVALASVVACFYSLVRRRADRTTAVLGLLLAGHVVNIAAYLWPLLKHGTNATVFATTFESLFFVFATAAVAAGRLRPTWSRRLAAVISAIALASGAVIADYEIAPVAWRLSNHPPASEGVIADYESAPVAWRLSNYAAIGAAVRQFDEVLNELSESYTVVSGPAFYANDHVLYWQLLMSEGFNNTNAGLGGPIDDRYQGNVQRERHSRYRFWTSHRVADVSDRCYALAPALAPAPPGRKWECFPLPFAFGKRYANVYAAAAPAANGEAWIEPLPGDVADPLLANRLATLSPVSYHDVRGHLRAKLLDGYPTVGVLGEPLGPSSHMRWSILPLRPEDLARLGPLETKILIEHDHVPFLASMTGYPIKNYLIWLPKSHKANAR